MVEFSKKNIFYRRLIQSIYKQDNYNNSTFKRGKKVRNIRFNLIRNIKDAFLILGGVLSALVGLKAFIIPNKFIDGGVMGISLLINIVTNWSLALLVFCINFPFIILSIKTVNKQFAIKTTIAIIALSIALAFINVPLLTHDKILVAIFGGFFLGTGIGLAVRGGAVIDGTEVLALFLSRKLSVTIGAVILYINVLIFLVAAYLLSIETAFYSILTYIVASKAVDFIIEGIDEYIGVTIISIKSDDIRLMIIETLGRGVTIYNGKRGYAKKGEKLKETDILYTVITRLELSKLKSEIEKIDPNSFLIMSSIKDTKGGMIKKRPLRQ